MAGEVTLELLEGYLRRFGWSRYRAEPEPDEREGRLLTGWRLKPEDPGYVMIIDPIVEKNVLVFHVPQLLSAPPERTHPDRLRELLIAIGLINYRIILGKFSYDPRDGEVRFTLAMPTDRNTLTYEQFEHCMRVTIAMVEQHVPRLRAILGGEEKWTALLDESKMETGLALLSYLLSALADQPPLKRPIYPETPSICYWGHTQERAALRLCADGRNYVCPRCCHEECRVEYPAWYGGCAARGWPVWPPLGA
ncbi:YbjN domain-containing protein [Thermoflexus hugenholtzii]